MRKGSPNANDYAMAWLRISVGILFLIFAEYKVFGTTFIHGDGFAVWIRQFLRDGAYPFMAPLLRDFVLPHARIFATIVSYGELAIGVALLLGVLVRSASFFGLFYMCVLIFSSNYPGSNAPVWEYFGASLNHLVLALCFLGFGMGNAARVWSLPSFVDRAERTREANDFDGLPPSAGLFNK